MKNNHSNQPGIFVPVPDAFKDADRPLRNLCKFEFKTAFSQKHRVTSVFSTNRLLVDLSELGTKALNIKKMIKDCDYLKEVLTKYPKELALAVKALNENSKAGILKAEKLLKKMGLTEKAASKAGGGLIWLVIPIVVAVAGGGCATVGSNKPLKAPTTPRPPNPPDARPPDGGSPQ